MTEFVALCSYSSGDRPKRFFLRSHGDDFADSLLLGRDLDQLAPIAATEPERDLAVKIAPTGASHSFEPLLKKLSTLFQGGGDEVAIWSEAGRPFCVAPWLTY
jgi:hypothetical protein